MRFLRPEAAWLLLAALPLVLLHLRRVRRRVVPVASVRLWRDLAQGGVGRRGFRKLRDGGALALLLLALAALTGALAEPVAGAAAVRPRSLVVILDGSVTMSARDASGSRFDAARRVVADALDRRGPDDDVTVWLAAGAPWVLAGPTRDAGAVRDALADAQPTLDARTLDDALERARAARALRREPATVLVVTDAPGAAALDDAEDVLVAAVGAAGPRNAAVLGASVTPRGVRVRIAALEGGPGERTLEVRVGDDVVAALPLTLAPGRELAPEVLVPADRSGRLVARLLPPDDFPDDDAAGLVLRRRPPLRVLVTAPGARAAPFLLEALRAMPDVVDADAALLASPDVALAVMAAADVVIADGAVPDALQEGAAAPRPLLAFVEAGERVARPLLWGIGAHPVLEGVDLAPLRLESATPLALQPGDAVLVDSAGGPLAVARERAGVRTVWCGFRAEASTLPLEPAFPLLVRNALRWLRDAGALPAAVTAGAPLALAETLPPGADEVVLALGDVARRAALGPDAADPSTPLPVPGGSRLLRVGLPGGAALGETFVQWHLPPGITLGADAPGPSPDAALARLPAPLAAAAPVRRLGPLLAALAALFLVLGAALLRTSPRPDVGARPALA